MMTTTMHTQRHLKRRQIHAGMQLGSSGACSKHLGLAGGFRLLDGGSGLHFGEEGFDGANVGVLRGEVGVARHTSHVTRHTSHVTRHTDLRRHLIDDVISRLQTKPKRPVLQHRVLASVDLPQRTWPKRYKNAIREEAKTLQKTNYVASAGAGHRSGR